MAKHELAYAALAPSHPGSVLLDLGVRSHRAATEGTRLRRAVMQAEGGLMSITGEADGPPLRPGRRDRRHRVGDVCCAGRHGRAVLSREAAPGISQVVDIAMLDSVAALLTYQAGIYFATGTAPARMGNRHPTIAPYETFRAADGDFVIAVGNDEQQAALCAAAGLDPEERFATNRQRFTLYQELKPLLAARLRTETRSHWIQQPPPRPRVPCGSVRDLHEMFSDPQIAARTMMLDVEHSTLGSLRLLGTPLKLSRTPPGVRTPPPTLGQHTDDDVDEGPGLRPRRNRGAAREGNCLMEISEVEEAAPGNRGPGEDARPRTGGRARTKRRASTRSSSSRWRFRSSGSSRTR